MPHGQAEALLPMVDRAMGAARLAASTLDLITVTTGPGSFTGIRVGLAGAKGIALGLGVPLLGVTSFEAGAAACEKKESKEKKRKQTQRENQKNNQCS